MYKRFTQDDLLQNGISHDSIIKLANIHNIHTKQHHILKELLETEKIYVKEMKSILSVSI